MTQSFIRNSSCWFEHMRLDFQTGMDPEGGAIKLRAAEGLEAVDFFFPGYHVWAKLIESLADLGYDANTLVRPISLQLNAILSSQNIRLISISASCR